MRHKILIIGVGIIVLLVLIVLAQFYLVPFITGKTKLIFTSKDYANYTLIEAPATIKIGTVTDQTGPLSDFGVQCKYGFGKSEEDINKDGGIYVEEFHKKIPVEVIYSDHSANEEKAIPEVELLFRQGVTVISGTTAISPYGLAVAEKNRIPILSNNSHTGPYQQGYKYVFCLFFQDDEMSKWPFYLIDYFSDPKPRKIGFMEEQSVMGMEFSLYFQKEAMNRKFSNLIVEKYNRLSKDYSKSIQAFKKAGVDFVYAPMIGPDGMLFWKQMKELDFVPKAILMFIAPAAHKDWITLGKDGDYVITSNGFHWATGYPGAKEFAEIYRKENKGANPPEQTGNSYAMMQVIKASIEKAGSLDRDKIRNAMASIDTMTIMGRVRFRANGMNLLKPFMVQYINGVERIIWPEDMAERSPVYPFPAWNAKKR